MLITGRGQFPRVTVPELTLGKLATMQTGPELQPPEEFPFPFQPYGIQKDFMRALYSALEKGCIGIFESPTGTVSVVRFNSALLSVHAVIRARRKRLILFCYFCKFVYNSLVVR